MQQPHRLNAENVLENLETSPQQGLSSAEASRRLSLYGPNELIEKGKKKAWRILLAQVKEVMILILLVAVVISLALQEYIDAIVIFVIVVLNTILGFWQEFKAENAMAALKKMTVPHVRVRRDGAEQQISAKDLVPGDILLIEAGNIVPADARLIAAVNLKVQEAALTGESESVEKDTDAMPDGERALADRKNMIYRGTVVTYGRGEAVATGTGMQTELGKIATMLQDVEDEQTPLQQRLAKLGRSLAIAAGVLILIVAGMLYLQGAGLKEIFMTAISMAVAAIPEGLPAVVTIALALGAQQMLKKNALIRQLPAVETLGGVTVICSDKTGTLTQNKMTVSEVVLPKRRYSLDEAAAKEGGDADLDLLLLAGMLCNDAVIDENAQNGILGDPTEGALVLAAQQAGWVQRDLQAMLPRVREWPFDSERKRMSTVHTLPPASQRTTLPPVLAADGDQGQADHLVLIKGATDGLIEVCNRILTNGVVHPFNEAEKEEISAENTAMAQKGVRVLGLAYRLMDAERLDQTAEYEQDLVFLGMVCMLDPVRPEAIESVRLCKQAGIRPVMITGDHPLTAVAIAKDLGLTTTDRVLTGQDLDKMTVDGLSARIKEVSVFARVSPKHKMIIIDALQAQHEIVSMTGDGVNDAPALKSADIGVAMGITGTDVSKESSDMVLLDDNFATIVAAVKEGRRIYDNIRKFVRYILTGNTGEIVVMLAGPLMGMPLPLLPIQILWINLVTDGVPAVALGFEEAERDVMKRPPYNPQESIFARGLGWQILVMGLIIGLLSVGTGYWFWNGGTGSNAWQTMVFTMLTFCQMAYALCVRKQTQSLFTQSWFSNPVLLLAIGVTLGLHLILVYVPFFNTVFRTTPLQPSELGICALGPLVIILISESKKLFLRRKLR
ncbi:cation-translocating P-type ATPase [Desulfuromonas acetexigens]|uniref:Cation-translocating P-type ATPase n=1 Tax=Trichloromonas acetexigens TaxID=38815 RepID=A0A550JAP4_9BACT|nr:cation-translocating P-type ATPase [Desulfuromonas acetexigens]TRO80329.1 cation-translocating P-type ATPase [Desulfuromonas acetexigens]